MSKSIIQEDGWQALKSYSRARIALGNTGGSLPLREVLNFRLAHANAKDAIYSALNIDQLSADIGAYDIPLLHLRSQAADRHEYLKRPDLGKKLNESSMKSLEKINSPFDIVIILTDGLSADALNAHALKVIHHFMAAMNDDFKVAFCIVEQGRVAIGDQIGQKLKAKFTAIFIGERPGLSSPDSLGIYTTYSPEVGTTDERRNCISNVHQEGLGYAEAAKILNFLMSESLRRRISGVELKLDMKQLLPP